MNPAFVEIGASVEAEWQAAIPKLKSREDLMHYVHINQEERKIRVHRGALRDVCKTTAFDLPPNTTFRPLKGPGLVSTSRVHNLEHQLIFLTQALGSMTADTLQHRVLSVEQDLIRTELEACKEFLSNVAHRQTHAPVSTR